MLVNVFFKEIKVIGTENIPKNETVIFCGNHANQFIDPCVILRDLLKDMNR
jgi:1-acyl-sn-glycerol-3-phosphate acyltransferase